MNILLRGLLLFCLCLAAGCVQVPQPGAAPEAKRATDPAELERLARLRLELASGYFSRGQPATALDEVKLALNAKPDMVEAWNLRALIYASNGEARQAEESFQRALQFKPNDPDSLHNYGWFLCQQGRAPEADQQFERALAQPQYVNQVRTLLAQGVCQARAGHLPEAERTLLRSYELDPANPATAYNLSDVLYRRGDLERARFYIGRVNSQPEQSNAQTLWLAARIENRMGNAAGSRFYGTQLSERFPNSPEALQYQRRRFDD